MMDPKKLFYLVILVLLLLGFVAIQSGAIRLSGILEVLTTSILIVLVMFLCVPLLFIVLVIVSGKRKAAGRPVDGLRPDQQLPPGEWAPSALLFHKRCGLVVSAVLADDEDVLDSFPIVPHDPDKPRPTSIRRIDKAFGCGFETDVEGERGYRLRYSLVRREVCAQDKADYGALFEAWAAYHEERGVVKMIGGQDGPQYCWKVGPDDVIGVRLERAGNRLSFSATRAWIIKQQRNRFRGEHDN